MKRLASLGVAILIVAAGCNDKQSHAKTDDPVTKVLSEDSEMNAAIKTAQTSLTNFIAIFSAPATNQKYFLIKARFTDKDVAEHIWVADLRYDGKVFYGVIANEPQDIPSLRFKQPVEVQFPQITDWMYVEDGKLVGGFTSRVLRNRKSEQERREQDANLRYRYD